MVRPERFELPASWFVARRSIQLSYGRKRARILPHRLPITIPAVQAQVNSDVNRPPHEINHIPEFRGFKNRHGYGVYRASAHPWRRGRDSNPRRAFDPYALSRGAPSTTRPPLRIEPKQAFAERGIIPARSSLGKARELTHLVRRRRSSWRVPRPHCRPDLVRA
jgi:hypothetical protein